MRPPWILAALTSWPRKFTNPRLDHPFRNENRSGVNWPETIRLLRKELDHLDAEHVTLQMAISAESIKMDGTMKANRAAPAHPGVILTFDSRKYGFPMSYPADRFTRWRANVRAIAVSLNNLRRVDRYGVTNTGEQYSGFKMIAARSGAGVDPHELIAGWAGWNATGVRAEPARALRLAKKASHPDSEDGSADHYKGVVAAGAALGL